MGENNQIYNELNTEYFNRPLAVFQFFCQENEFIIYTQECGSQECEGNHNTPSYMPSASVTCLSDVPLPENLNKKNARRSSYITIFPNFYTYSIACYIHLFWKISLYLLSCDTILSWVLDAWVGGCVYRLKLKLSKQER